MQQWWDAWMAWWDGSPTGSMPLWPWTVQWWGRLGKMMQFGAGLAVVLDLVGAVRIKQAAARVKTGTLALQRLHARVWRVWVAWGTGKEDEAPISHKYWIYALGHAVLLAVILGAARLLPELPQDPAGAGSLRFKVLVGVHGLMILLALLPAVLILATIFLRFHDILRLITFVFAALPSHLASRAIGANLDAHPLRVTAFIVFVIGFHFDLLAS